MPDTAEQETTAAEQDAVAETGKQETTEQQRTGEGKPDSGAGEADLGDAGKAAIAREREARKQAEREARDLKKRLEAIDAEKLSETEKLQRQAEQGQQAAATATDKLRRANLITALAEEGVSGRQARAAVRLLEGVEFDDTDEPTNLSDAITAAKAEYGDDVFTPRAATASTDTTDGKNGATPDLHAGPRQTDDKGKPESTGWFDHKLNKKSEQT